MESPSKPERSDLGSARLTLATVPKGHLYTGFWQDE